MIIKYENSIKKDLKKIIKRGYNIELFKEVVRIFAENRELDAKYKDHKLKGKWLGFRELHIKDDWILIYRHDEKDILTLCLTRTGTHSDLFD